jgi:hypothetical protein
MYTKTARFGSLFDVGWGKLNAFNASKQETCPMKRAVAAAFFDHPATVGENYAGHGRFALWFSFKLMQASLAALVHAILPFAFQTTASNVVKELHKVVTNRSHHQH